VFGKQSILSAIFESSLGYWVYSIRIMLVASQQVNIMNSALKLGSCS